MGTNFYLVNKKTGQRVKHIGKRSFGGPYCWNCHLTLCKKGEGGIHQSDDFFDNCPKCGKEVDSICTTFIWAEFNYIIKEMMDNDNDLIILDEYAVNIPYNEITDYDHGFASYQKFHDIILVNTPINFYHSIGTQFS